MRKLSYEEDLFRRTRRQQLQQLLMQGPISPQEIAYKYGADMGEILDDLRHVAKTCRVKGLDMRIIPARCEKCGFEFREKSDVRCPSKCPKCKSEWIKQPMFFIQEKN